MVVRNLNDVVSSNEKVFNKSKYYIKETYYFKQGREEVFLTLGGKIFFLPPQVNSLLPYLFSRFIGAVRI